MSTIFIDESGDLSFNFNTENSHRFFVVSALVCDNPKVLDKIIKKTFLSIEKKVREKRRGRIFHANQENDAIKKQALSLLAKTGGIKTTTLLLDKYKHIELAQNDKHKLYNYLIYELIKRSRARRCEAIYMSKRESKKTLNTIMVHDIKKLLDNPKVSIEVASHYSLCGLQTVDFVAHAVYCKYEFGQKWMYEIIAGQDKTLEAFTLHNPVPLLQGDYLSYPHYTKLKKKVKHEA